MADKSMLSLFSMPLLQLIFSPLLCAVCGDLNFAQFNLVHSQEQSAAISGFQLEDSHEVGSGQLLPDLYILKENNVLICTYSTSLNLHILH